MATSAPTAPPDGPPPGAAAPPDGPPPGAAAPPKAPPPGAAEPRHTAAQRPHSAARRGASCANALATAAPVLLWAGVVLAGHLLAARLVDADYRVHVGAPPLVGSFDLRLSWSLSGALVLAAGALAFGPGIARRLRWRSLLGASWLAGCAWIVALGVGTGGGWRALWAPLQTRYEYLAAVPRVGDAHSFLQGFAQALPSYPTHVRGHPPGMVLLLWVLDHAGLGGPRWAAALVIGAGAAAAPAALVAMRALAEERAARRAAPFVTLAPAAVWLGTSADALFSTTLAVGVALLAVACASPRAARTSPAATRAEDVAGTATGERAHRRAPLDTSGATCRRARGLVSPITLGAAGRRPDALALLAGLVLGCGLLLSYGLAPLGLVPLAVAVLTRRWRLLALATAGAAAVLLAFAAAGFWWPSGLGATHDLYAGGVAARRPYLDFLVISPAAFALALGPAALVGLAHLRARRAWILPGAALAALLVAELSGLSRGESERIWLPFVPWLLLATASLRAPRAWLAAQLTLAIALQVAVRSPW
jgi:hypothetical protein